MKQNILFLSYDGLSDQLGFSQITPYLENIAKNNVKIKVISFEKKINFNRYKKIIIKNLNKKCIEWLPLSFSSRFKRFSKIIDIIKLFYFIFINIYLKKYNIIHARGHLTAYVAYFLSIFFNFNLIFDFRGFWVDERIDNKSLNRKKMLDNYFYIFFKYLEKKSLLKSKFVIVLTKKAKIELIKLYSLNEAKIVIIPCCTDYKKFNNINQSKIEKIKSKYLNNSDIFIITYIGSLGGVYLLNEMLDFFKTFRLKNKNAIFQILTNQKSIANNILIKSYSELQNYVCIKSVQKSQIPFFLSISNYTLSFINPTYARQASCPTKLSESFAAGIPVITNQNYGDISEIIKKYNCGLLIDNFDNDNYERISNTIIHNNIFKKNIIQNNTSKYFDISYANKKYDNIYKNLL